MALARADIADGAARLPAEGYSLYLASHRRVLEHLEPAPFGVPVSALDLLAPHDAPWAIADLMRVYNVLNATAFGPKGIPLQNWVMIDLGLLPSAFVLVTLPPDRARAALQDPGHDAAGRARIESVLPAVLAEADRLGYTGPIPVAGYCAAPTPASGEWVGWSLCTAIPGLGTLTKGLALEVYRARGLTGVVQFWDGAGVRVHRRFGRMEILAAVLDLHPVPNTFVYRTELYAEDDAAPTIMLDCRDVVAQQEIQSRIDSGASRFFVLSPGLVDDRVPILECT